MILQTNLLLTSLKIIPYKAHSVISLPLPEITHSSLTLSTKLSKLTPIISIFMLKLARPYWLICLDRLKKRHHKQPFWNVETYPPRMSWTITGPWITLSTWACGHLLPDSLHTEQTLNYWNSPPLSCTFLHVSPKENILSQRLQLLKIYKNPPTKQKNSQTSPLPATMLPSLPGLYMSHGWNKSYPQSVFGSTHTSLSEQINQSDLLFWLVGCLY